MLRILFLICTLPLLAQPFDSGSDGSDGALNLTDPGEFFFTPSAFDPPLDQDGDGIYNFTTINIDSGVIVRFPSGTGPIYWLASGSVQISGFLNLDGQPGHENGGRYRSSPGPGGFSGGMGPGPNGESTPGSGPGRSLQGVNNAGGAGHASIGDDGSSVQSGGPKYGNRYALPLIGGSGGGGGGHMAGIGGAGGGAGGGAILIASSSEIVIDGTISANGGDGGTYQYDGGGGSGGTIRLVAPVVRGAGSLYSRGGNAIGKGAPGRIRIEGNAFGGFIDGDTSFGPPGLLFLSTNQSPIRIVRIDGVDVPAVPHGGFVPPDVTISNAAPVIIELETKGVPTGTVISLSLIPQTGEPINTDSTPVAGNLALGTATATVQVPFGFSQFFVQADWSP